MRLHHLCKTIFPAALTIKRRLRAILLIMVLVFANWGCGSSNHNEPSLVAEENGSGLRLEIQMPAGSDPSVVDRFEVSVTGPGIELFNHLTNLVGAFPQSVALGDLNGDQLLDVVTANARSDDVSILLGSGNGIFFADQRFFVQDSPSSVALASVQDDIPFDVNNDGFLDIIVANSNLNVVSILRSAASLKAILPTAQYERVTIEGRDKLVFYLTLPEEVEVPLGPSRTFTVRAFLPGSSEPDFDGSTTQTFLSPDTPAVVNLSPVSSSP